MKKSRILFALVLCLVMVFSTGIAAADQEPVFSDISGHWAEEAVTEMYTYGIVKGYEDGTYGPQRVLTRAEFAVMLDRVLTVRIWRN